MKTHVLEWTKQFKKGPEWVDDHPRERCSRTDRNIDGMSALSTSERRLNIRTV